MGFDLYETLLQRQPLSEVLKFAAGRTANSLLDDSEPTASSCPTDRATEPSTYSHFERGTDSIPISVQALCSSL